MWPRQFSIGACSVAEQGRSTRAIAFLLASMAALGPFSIDTYLPSFHDIGQSLRATPIEVQQTLSVYLLAFAVMTLWHGALSDRFGRRRVILVALALFGAASAGCAFATSIEQLWLWRGLQGMTAGAGMVVSRAIVRDLFDGPPAQRLIAQITMMFALAPAIAPMIGGWLQTWFGWRSVFAFLVLSTATLWIACWKLLPETLPLEKRQSLHPAYLGKAYWSVLTSPPFLFASGALSLNFVGFFVYVLSAPVFLMNHLGVSETSFLWLFGPAMGGLMLGSWLAGRFAGRRSPGATVKLGYAVMAAAALINVVLNLILPPSLPWSVLPLFLYTLGMSLAMPNLTLFALDPFPDNRGMAASCQTFMQSGFNSVVAAAVAPAVWGSTLSLALAMAGFLVLGSLAALLYLRSILLPG